ncbi:hypothetical protein FGG79_09135 [Bacillus sp. BHET2]|uniref:phosphotransferase enzyme family protein n=1 Tax=Bacillus sp. BHET2 TaxID=2583818 RepID=UPI00110F5DBD|nr:phosphotransferase [Bacillus sp. BHET2]TMU88244.1 hypothetical protein FGG79_09135 [Bacillus sp. BHET2]
MIQPFGDILWNWNVKHPCIETLKLHPNVVKLVSEGKSYYLKKREDSAFENRMEEYYLTTYLLANRLNVESPLLTISHQPFVKKGQQFYSLYEKIEGEPLQEYSLSYLTNAGTSLANLHGLLKNYHCHKEIKGWHIDQHIRQWLNELGLTPIGKWARDILLRLDEWTILYNQLPYQLIHSDYNRGNIMVKEGVVSGIIDFERIRVAPRVADIGYFLTGMLKDRIKKNREDSINYIGSFLRGYDQLSTLTSEEKELLPLLIVTFLLQYVFFYHQCGYSEVGSTYISFINELVQSSEYDHAFHV